jgi:hypothetical protein
MLGRSGLFGRDWCGAQLCSSCQDSPQSAARATRVCSRNSAPECEAHDSSTAETWTTLFHALCTRIAEVWHSGLFARLQPLRHETGLVLHRGTDDEQLVGRIVRPPFRSKAHAVGGSAIKSYPSRLHYRSCQGNFRRGNGVLAKTLSAHWKIVRWLYAAKSW